MEAIILKSQKKKQNVAIVEWASTPKKNVNKKFLPSQILGNKKFLEAKEMTTKKSKNYDLTPKTDFKNKPNAAIKKKNQNTKRIETFFPVSNEADQQKTN